MNKTTKIIVSIAVTVVIAASIVTVSLFKESEPTTQQPSFSVPSTNFISSSPILMLFFKMGVSSKQASA